MMSNSTVRLGKSGARVTLSDGRELEVPRWNARIALEIGRMFLASMAGGGGENTAAKLPDVLRITGEAVCVTLGEPAEFLETLTKEDLVEIASAIYEQEFKTKEFGDCLKKAGALLPDFKPHG